MSQGTNCGQLGLHQYLLKTGQTFCLFVHIPRGRNFIMNFNPQENQHYYPPSPPPVTTNGKSIAALVLGILAIVIPYIGLLFGIIAIIFSTLALKEIRIRQDQGRGLAIAGLVCGIIGTIIYAILILLFIIFALVVSGMNNFNTI